MRDWGEGIEEKVDSEGRGFSPDVKFRDKSRL